MTLEKQKNVVEKRSFDLKEKFKKVYTKNLDFFWKTLKIIFGTLPAA